MHTVEQFKNIIAREQKEELMIFLRSLSPDQKKQLVPLVKTLSKDYWAYGLIYDKTENVKGTERQQHMIQHCAFVCLNKTDYEKSLYYIWFLTQPVCIQTLEWYVPVWLDDLVNHSISEDQVRWDYNWLTTLTEKGVLQPSKEVMARGIPELIYEFDAAKKHYVCIPKNLLKRPVTLQEHIWYLFEYDTNIHSCDRYLRFDEADNPGWQKILVQLAASGQIDRQRLLKASLLASNKNFNKVLSGWFIQLFTDLTPTSAELITLQKELTGILTAPHSKPVTVALNAIKKLIPENEFNSAPFLDAVPALLTSATKAIVNTTLDIQDKLIQQQPGNAATIALPATHVFIHPDDELQAKAARLIIKTIVPDDSLLRNTLLPYQTTMLSSARQLLAAALEQKVAVKEENPIAVNRALTPIAAITSINDLVFLASQAFDNNQPWHIFLLPASLLQWQQEMQPADLQKFEPALQRAIKTIEKGPTSKQGKLDHSLAEFFVWVCNGWAQKHPAATKTLSKHLDKLKLEQTPSPIYTSPYKPYKLLFRLVLEKLAQGDTLPLLSTPTHEPGWVSALILTERLIQYQENNILPDETDLQIAISRCYLHNTAQAVELAEQKLTGEYSNLLLFLFNKYAEPQPPFNLQSAWMTASLTKKEKRRYTTFDTFLWYKKPLSYYTGQHEWQVVEENFYKVITVSYQQQAGPMDQRLFLGDYLLFQRVAGINENDIQRIMLLTPNNPDPLLPATLHASMRTPEFWEVSDKQYAIAMARALHSIWDGAGNMAHVFLAACMINAEKTLANLAAEIWINGVSNNNINSADIGNAIGIMESVEFAPIKRFTDLAMTQLIRISEKHNQELQLIVEQLLAPLPGQPVPNLKKLLELYTELLVLNNRSITSQQLIDKLHTWKSNKPLQKIAGDLLKKSG